MMRIIKKLMCVSVIAVIVLATASCSNNRVPMPNRMQVIIEKSPNKAVKWGYEANKMTSKVDILLFINDGEKRRFRVGDTLSLNGKEYKIQKFVNNTLNDINSGKPVKVDLLAID